jgi:hypothetical protein
LLGDRLHTLVSTLWLVEVGPVLGCSYGKKTESTNGVDRIIGVCPINKLRKTSSLPTSHTTSQPTEDALISGVKKLTSKATLRLHPYSGKGDKNWPCPRPNPLTFLTSCCRRRFCEFAEKVAASSRNRADCNAGTESDTEKEGAARRLSSETWTGARYKKNTHDIS